MTKIPIEEKELLIKNKYIYDVTEYAVMLTEEGKEFVYDGYCEGRSVRKSFSLMGIPFTPAIERMVPRLIDYLVVVKKRNGNFARKRHFKNKATIDKKYDYKEVDKLRHKLLVKEQEIEFLKKITKTEN